MLNKRITRLTAHRFYAQKAATANEDEEQMTVMEWAAYNAGKWPALKWLYHTPNGGSRNVAEAAKLKRMGVKPGVPDLFLPYPAGGFCGLWLEMKTETGRPSSSQKEWIDYLRSVGYAAYICHGAGEAINALEAYLSSNRQSVKRDYKELIKALHDIDNTMSALGTSPINIYNISLGLAYEKGWGRTANDAANTLEEILRTRTDELNAAYRQGYDAARMEVKKHG